MSSRCPTRVVATPGHPRMCSGKLRTLLLCATRRVQVGRIVLRKLPNVRPGASRSTGTRDPPPGVRPAHSKRERSQSPPRYALRRSDGQPHTELHSSARRGKAHVVHDPDRTPSPESVITSRSATHAACRQHRRSHQNTATGQHRSALQRAWLRPERAIGAEGRGGRTTPPSGTRCSVQCCGVSI
jgi:hypothetical protein